MRYIVGMIQKGFDDVGHAKLVIVDEQSFADAETFAEVCNPDFDTVSISEVYIDDAAQSGSRTLTF
jgi:hypothetical protein